MHFVICVFIALVCLATVVIFTEVFPKWSKIALALIGSGATGYAIAILIRKIAMITKAFAKPDLLPTIGIATIIVIIIVCLVSKKLSKKA